MLVINHSFFSTDDDRFKQAKIADEKIPRLSEHRHEIVQKYNNQYGENNWRFAWRYGHNYLNFLEACAKYEEAFAQHFNEHPEKLGYLSKNASDLYDTNPSNIKSGTEYTRQEDSSTHLQDIAIRRIMAKLNIPFNGTKLIQIRSTSEDPVGATLTPLKVPFHEPAMVLTDKENPTIEDFWQCNRVIQFLDSAIKHD